jgi:hypothetical protein
MRSIATAAFLICLGPLGAQIPPSPSLDTVLERMGAYLREYESQLSKIVADERYDQRQVLPPRTQANSPTTIATRRLESEIVFMRMPGNTVWFGFRETRRVDGHVVPTVGRTLVDLIAAATDPIEQGMAITSESSKHNLGMGRNINMPTVPLEPLQSHHRDRFEYRLAGSETIRGARTVRLVFQEISAPTIIRDLQGGNVFTSGAAWVDPSAGRLWRVEIFCRVPGAKSAKPKDDDSSVRVDFAVDSRLNLLVPVEMREVFQVRVGRGEGRETYRNFRRFQTSARIVPPPPQP